MRGPWSESQRRALGTTIATLHLATPALQHLVPRRETFEVAYEPDLRRNLAVAAGLPPHARLGALAARHWAVATRATLEAQLARLHDLRAGARAFECTQVICHMDLHGGNVLVDTAGVLHILDWDDVRLAPPEFDLWFGLDGATPDVEGVRGLIEGYRAGGVRVPLHPEHVAFYLLRRDLEDVSIALARLLDAAADRRDDPRWAQGLHDWGAARWATFDARFEVVARALA